MSWTSSILRHGRCPTCKKVYSWEDRDGLRLKDAVCIDCDTQLIKAMPAKAGPNRVVPIEVEAEWLRRRAT